MHIIEIMMRHLVPLIRTLLENRPWFGSNGTLIGEMLNYLFNVALPPLATTHEFETTETSLRFKDTDTYKSDDVDLGPYRALNNDLNTLAISVVYQPPAHCDDWPSSLLVAANNWLKRSQKFPRTFAFLAFLFKRARIYEGNEDEEELAMQSMLSAVRIIHSAMDAAEGTEVWTTDPDAFIATLVATISRHG